MMDLTKKALPNTVLVGGRAYSIYTDFRLWMRFEIEVSKMRSTDTIDVGYLFKNEKPSYCDMKELFVFSRPQNPLPRSVGRSSNAIIIDYELDSDLIYSAILGQYGIDLIEVEELHWHKFLALIRGLNDSTVMSKVMGYRSYDKYSDKNKDIYDELRIAWSIERMTEQEEMEAEKFSSYFD